MPCTRGDARTASRSSGSSGPTEATRTRVLEHLMMRRYDVLHFAGHCVFDKENPALSGWLFHKGKGQRLSAYELNRVDRVPRFVFSNACESGVLGTKSGAYSPGLAPGFAEAFFERGVSNFICTAWPIDDGAALEFALWVYQYLLGLRPQNQEGAKFTVAPPEPMHVAMRQARLQIAGQPHGVRTWGAYQHYGNPYYRFFDPEAMKGPKTPASSPSATAPEEGTPGTAGTRTESAPAASDTAPAPAVGPLPYNGAPIKASTRGLNKKRTKPIGS